MINRFVNFIIAMALDKTKLYAQDKKENLNLFKNVEVVETYSNLSQRLDKMFQGKTFGKFLEDLKNNYKVSKETFCEMFEADESKKRNKYIGVEFDLKTFKQYLQSIDENEQQRKIKNKPKPLNVSISPIRKKAQIKPEVPDIGVYHPNFSSIDKKIPRAFISNSKFIRNEEMFKVIESESSISFNDICKRQKYKSYTMNRDSPERTINQRYQKTEILPRIQTTSLTIETNNNGTNCLSNEISNKEKEGLNIKLNASSYRTRNKGEKNETTSSLNGILSEKRILGCVDFNKMSSNPNIPPFPYEKPKESWPTLGMYQPKYDYFNKHIPNIYINNSNNKQSPNKKRALHKLVCSFDIPTKYVLVKELNKQK